MPRNARMFRWPCIKPSAASSSLILATLAACASVQPLPGVATADLAVIQPVLDRLYRAFSFNANESPDWVSMRSLFADGACFVAPIRSEAPAQACGADKFVSDFRAWVESSPEGRTGLHERIVNTRIEVLGTIAHAWVLFEGYVPGGDELAQTRGVDSIQLVLSEGEWLLASFTTQYANDQLAIPARFER